MEKKFFGILLVVKLFEIYSVIYAYCMISLYHRKIKNIHNHFPLCNKAFVVEGFSTDYLLLTVGLFSQIIFLVLSKCIYNLLMLSF